MVNVKYGIAAGVVAIAAVNIFLFLPSERRKVERRFAQLSELVEKNADESPVRTALMVKRMTNLFMEPFVIETDMQRLSGSHSHVSLAALAGAGRQHFQRMKLEFSDLQIEFPESLLARAVVTASLKGKIAGGGNVHEVRELVWTLKKVEEDGWMFSDCKTVNVLEK